MFVCCRILDDSLKKLTIKYYRRYFRIMYEGSECESRQVHLLKNMKITIDLDDIQLGKQYVLSFSIAEDGNVLTDNLKKKSTKNTLTSPNIEDFEAKEQRMPSLKEPIIKKEFKVESSFDGKIIPN